MSKTFIHAIIASAFLLATPASAAPDMSNIVGSVYDSGSIVKTKSSKNESVRKVSSTSRGRYNAGPKPGRWCGWWMRTQFGGGPEYNLARNWAKRGRPAGGPGVGVVVVWRGHVGIITGKAANGQWIVKSGNDSNRVRERARSLKHRTGNPIAYRIV